MTAASPPADAMPDLPLWDQTYNLRVAGGYKDNLLLGHSATESSPLLNTQAEASFVRLPLDGTQVLVLFSGEGIYYPAGQQVTHEETFFTVGQIKRTLNPNWEIGLSLQHLYQDQIIDATTSLDEYALLGGARAVNIRGHGLRAAPTVRRNLPGHYWLEAEFTGERQWLRAPLDSYWSFGPKLTLGHDFGARSSWKLSYEFRDRIHDSTPQLDGSGLVLPGTILAYVDHEVAGEWRQFWDVKRTWRTTTRLSYTQREDNGSGYFDYHRYQFVEQLRYGTKKWEASVQARLTYYDYPVQTVSLADLNRRDKTMLQINLHGERQVAKHLKIFANYEHERLLSNRDIDEYTVNTVTAGVDWEF